MPDTFSLSQSRCMAPDSSVREELVMRTGSEKAAAGILRSIERFGHDPSIVRYEISSESHGRAYRSSAALTWTVRAVRAGRG